MWLWVFPHLSAAALNTKPPNHHLIVLNQKSRRLTDLSHGLLRLSIRLMFAWI